MKITFTINTENAAFDDAPEIETARLLREAAQLLENAPGPSWFTLRDVNGNTVAEVEITE